MSKIIKLSTEQMKKIAPFFAVEGYSHAPEYLWNSLGGLLYIPATKLTESFLEKHIIGANEDMKSVCFDLEDSVLPEDKSKALEQLCAGLDFLDRYIKEKGTQVNRLPYIFVRLDTENAFSYYNRIMQSAFTSRNEFLGFVLPKFCPYTRMGYSVDYHSILIDVKDRCLNESLYIVPVLEDAAFIDADITTECISHYFSSYPELVTDDLQLNQFILGIRVGGNDWLKSRNLHLYPNESVWDIFDIAQGLSKIVKFAEANGFYVSAPVYNYFNMKDDSDFRAILRKHQLNGLRGVTAIHPSQLSIINEVYAVPFDRFQFAVLLLKSSVAVFKVNGSDFSEMAESVVMDTAALNILKDAYIYGVIVSDEAEADYIYNL